MRPPRVEQRAMDLDPHRRVLLPKIVGQLGIRHQVEPHQLHGSLLNPFVAPAGARTHPSTAPAADQWMPAFAGMTTKIIRARRRRRKPEHSGVYNLEFSKRNSAPE